MKGTIIKYDGKQYICTNDTNYNIHTNEKAYKFNQVIEHGNFWYADKLNDVYFDKYTSVSLYESKLKKYLKKKNKTKQTSRER